LLETAGLERYAESEMRYGARNGANPWALALRMAETASRRGAHGQAVRYIKGTVPGYLFLPREAAPERFWRLAFPFPYHARIEQLSRQHGLDQFLVASLIRQESEFDPLAVSYAGAIGLMQVMPPTGREQARRLRLGRSSVARLKNPDFNLQLGTDYLRRMLSARNGNVEETLAGYNAGGSRVKLWETWGPFKEPNEFVETIPFTQTRDYVQIILRNRDIYRWLYAGTPAPPAPKETAAPDTAAKKAPAAKKPAAKQSARKKK
jgi:soluble lytic murein transglycosylase